mmetsp:Transcript_38790/g.91613  ORF Transcript_38790/g.91613 Transcript_38790/m.91613 type:complete len:218 (+) Transcript_38790:716-1369(+)
MRLERLAVEEREIRIEARRHTRSDDGCRVNRHLHRRRCISQHRYLLAPREIRSLRLEQLFCSRDQERSKRSVLALEHQQALHQLPEVSFTTPVLNQLSTRNPFHQNSVHLAPTQLLVVPQSLLERNLRSQRFLGCRWKGMRGELGSDPRVTLAERLADSQQTGDVLSGLALIRHRMQATLRCLGPENRRQEIVQLEVGRVHVAKVCQLLPWLLWSRK